MTQFPPTPSSTPSSAIPRPSPSADFTAAAHQFTTAAHHLALAAAAAQNQNFATSTPTSTQPTATQSTASTPAATQEDPNRVSCKLPFYPGPGVVSRQQHSDASGKRFFLAIPPRKEGAFTEGQVVLFSVRRARSDAPLSFRKWDQAEVYWAGACHSWHGAVCPRAVRTRPAVTAATRISLTLMMSRDRFWAVKGIAQIFETRGAAVAAAEEVGFSEIVICGGYNVEALEEFALEL
ncbi:hypothetical protein FB451DRAFT_1421738 [Mycena latifolia]|nr:hypothetical protein FB451DRAFT_1421738 [Mycena latifolia]